MEFNEVKKMLTNHIAEMIKGATHLFTTEIDGDKLWETYINNFPVGKNDIYRKKGAHECSACRRFVRQFGDVVAIKNNKLVTIWDMEFVDEEYSPSFKALSEMVKKEAVKNIFLSREERIGVDSNREETPDGKILTWEHYSVKLPKQFVNTSADSLEKNQAKYRDARNCYKRAMEELTQDSIDTVLELIAQKSLYKGDEYKGILEKVLKLHKEYQKVPAKERDNYSWVKSIEVGEAVSKIRNHLIGMLLVELSAGTDLDEAVRKYEASAAPANYKRPKAIFTKKMVEDAEKTLTNLGLIDSLRRRHAKLDDITVNNILFCNKDSAKRIKGSVFDEMKEENGINPKTLSKVEEISIEDFLANVLPNVSNIEMLLENKHCSNLVSLIAPELKDVPSLFKWHNGFSWAYNGNITDSMKERVKSAGGNVEGVLRFSIQWNEDGDNQNDFDAHCVQPKYDRIMFRNKGQRHQSSGMLDVDIIEPMKNIAVENIIFTDKTKMPEGNYEFLVHNYNHRGGRSGFRAQIEFDGQIFEYDYNKDVLNYAYVEVAVVNYSKMNGFKMVKTLENKTSSREVWNVKTNQFVPVSVLMFSPNYWDEQTGIGHRHYFFMLKGCQNDTSPNGFFNEFLKEELNIHKRVFESLGGKMKVEPIEDQLSGVGFSSTQRNSVIVKVSGSFTRTLKINF